MARQHDDDDAFETLSDGRKILRDKHSYRVPVFLRDARQTAIAERAAALDGTTFDAASRRPGYRHTSDADMAAVDTAYEDYEQKMSRAWMRGRDAEGGVEGGICTVRNEQYPDDFGSPGHYDADGVCVPDRLRDDSRRDALPVRDEREAEYAAYNARMTNAWRTPS